MFSMWKLSQISANDVPSLFSRSFKSHLFYILYHHANILLTLYHYSVIDDVYISHEAHRYVLSPIQPIQHMCKTA